MNAEAPLVPEEAVDPAPPPVAPYFAAVPLACAREFFVFAVPLVFAGGFVLGHLREALREFRQEAPPGPPPQLLVLQPAERVCASDFSQESISDLNRR